MLSPFELNLRHLRGVLAVRDHGSVSAAASELHLSQPALTQGIVKLENQLGHILFERRPEGMLATTAGELVVKRIRAAMDQLTVGTRMLMGNGFQPERRITMTQLRAYLSLVDFGSFSTAGAKIGLSQTAIHRAVRDLEAGLEKKLVERRGRGVHVNFNGRRFARSARLAVNEIQAAFLELGIAPQNSTIVVGTTPLARAFLVPEAMAQMVAEKFPAGFRVLEGSWSELVELLRDGVIDLIVGELTSHDSPDLSKIPLYQESLVIVGGSQHSLVGKKRPSLKTLAAYPWIVGPENSPLRAEWELLFSGFNRPVSPIECGSVMIIGRLLTSSELLTIATPDQVALQIRSGLLARIGPPLTDSKHTIGVTMRYSWQPTAAQHRFIELLATVSANITSRIHKTVHLKPGWV